MGLLSLGRRLIDPALELLRARQDRRRAISDADARIRVAQQETESSVILKRHEVEALAVKGLASSWKDEYITLSIILIFNLILAGGLLAAFGRPGVLEGVVIALEAMDAVGIDVGLLIKVTVFTGLGLYAWNRTF